MSKAFEIMATARNSNDGVTAAEAVAIKVDQDWATEATIYTFDDGSVLVASGPQLNAYAGEVLPQYRVDAAAVTGEWIGDVEYIDYVLRSDWDAKTDTSGVHYDTYESDDETRAIEVNWLEADTPAVVRYFAADVDDAVRIAVVESSAHDGFDGFRNEIQEADLPADFDSWRICEAFSHGNNAVTVRSVDGD